MFKKLVATQAFNQDVHLAAMTAEDAAEIVRWRYPVPYDMYDLTDVAALVDPANSVYAVIDDDAVIGFRSFGPDGRVPGGSYDESALDTGGGLRPDLTGRGLGRTVIAAGLEFGRETYRPGAFRVTVASFNERALRVVRSLGFEGVAIFIGTTDDRSYSILVRQERRRSDYQLVAT